MNLATHSFQADNLGIVGPKSDSHSDIDDADTSNIKSSAIVKGKRKAGEIVEWSEDDEEVDVFEKFKNRKATKRKKVAAVKKAAKAKTKEILEDRKKAKQNGEPSKKPKKERVWGDMSDNELVDDDIPEYLRARRKEFDNKYQKYHEEGLRVPPRYEDIDFSDDERLEQLAERPNFPESVEPSREYKDIELPHSAGVIPASIARYLRDYQVDGVAFLHELFVYQKGQ